MTLDTRARQAAQGIHRAVEVMEMSTSTQQHRKVERFDRYRDRKQRNRRIGAIAVAAALTAAIMIAAIGTLQRGETDVPSVPPINASNISTMHEIATASTDRAAVRMAAGDGVLVVGTFASGKVHNQLITYPYPCGGSDPACEPLWTAHIDDGALPTVSDGVVYARGIQGHTLYAFATDCGTGGATCKPMWTADIGTGAKAPEGPLVAEGRVYVGSTDMVRGFDVGCGTGGATCSPAWFAETRGQVDSMAYANGVLFVGTSVSTKGPPDPANLGSIEAFRAPCERMTGCVMAWEQQVGQVWDLAVDGGMVYVGTNGLSDGIQAYAASCAHQRSCQPAWIGATTCCTKLTATDGFVYAHDHITSTYEFAADCGTGGSTCTPIWRASPLGDPFVDFSRPLVASDLVFVGGADDSVYAFPKDCSASCLPAWQTYVGDASGDEDAVVLDNHLYVAAGDGLHVYAPDEGPQASSAGSTDPVWWAAAALVVATLVGLGIALVRRRGREAV